MGDPCFLVLLLTVTLGRMQPHLRHRWDTAQDAAGLEEAWLIAGPSSWHWTHIAAGLVSGGDNPGRGHRWIAFFWAFFIVPPLSALNSGSAWLRRSNSGVLQFYYAIYSKYFGWAHGWMSFEEPQLLLLLKVKQIQCVRLPCCSAVTNDCSICCCFPGHGAFSTSATPPGSKSWLSMLGSLCPQLQRDCAEKPWDN